MKILSELIKQTGGKKPQGVENSCPVCGASAAEREKYPAAGGIETCPSGVCRVCWYRLGRATPERDSINAVETISNRSTECNSGYVEYGNW